MGKHYFFLVFVTIFLINSLTSAFTPRGGDLKNGQSDMKPVTFNQPWTTEEQVCLVLPLHARTKKNRGKFVCSTQCQSFNETSWLPQRLLICRCLVSLAEIFHLSFPCGLWGINVLPTGQLTFTTSQLPTINVYSRMYPQLQWNSTFFWGVMMELLDTNVTRCQRIGHLTNFVPLSRLNWKSCCRFIPRRRLNPRDGRKLLLP